MLGVVSREVGLPVPVLRVAIPHWIIAETMNISGGMSLLLCYRSTYLRDEDSYYSEVAALLNRSKVATEIYRKTIEDPDMMHGAGEWSAYLLDPTDDLCGLAQLAVCFGEFLGEAPHPLDAPEMITGVLQGLKEGVR